VSDGGSLEVSISADSGQSVLVSGLEYVYYAEPSVTGVRPSRGALEGGTYVSVLGSGFSGEGVQCMIGEQVVVWPEARLLTSSAVSCAVPRGLCCWGRCC